jgi:hypothetical protein
MSHGIRVAPGRRTSQTAPFGTIAVSGFAVLATLCVALASAPASAQTLRMGGGTPPPSSRPHPSGPARPLFRPAPPTVVNTAPGVVYQPRFFYRVPSGRYSAPHSHGPYSHKPIPYAPTYFPGPYVAPTYGQWVPGHWAYTWAPQGQATSVWVPGYYDKDGVWVAGYHATQVTQSGHYQPYWVSGYWAP